MLRRCIFRAGLVSSGAYRAFMPSKSSENTPSRRGRRQPPGYIGIQEAAAYLGVDDKTIRRAIAAGRLKASRLGPKLIKIKMADLEAMLTPMQGGAA